MPLNDDPDNAEAPLVTPATLDGETPLGTPATLDGEDQGEEAMQLKLINEQIHAIKQCISLPEGKRLVYISFDEWASSQGHCVINILIGRGKNKFVVESKALECKGPNDGVENTEVMQVVHDTLVSFVLSSDDVHFFVTDGDGVVAAAVNKLLPLYPLALPIVCGVFLGEAPAGEEASFGGALAALAGRGGPSSFPNMSGKFRNIPE